MLKLNTKVTRNSQRQWKVVSPDSLVVKYKHMDLPSGPPEPKETFLGRRVDQPGKVKLDRPGPLEPKKTLLGRRV